MTVSAVKPRPFWSPGAGNIKLLPHSITVPARPNPLPAATSNLSCGNTTCTGEEHGQRQNRSLTGNAGRHGARRRSQAWVRCTATASRAASNRSSGDEVLLNQGTIYASLVRLQQRGWISAEWGVSGNNRKAKFYAITRQGRKQLAREDTTTGES